MPKNYFQNAEERSVFLSPVAADGEMDKKGERVDTLPLREAKFIDIERIEPDPTQPRKTFMKETLESLAESIRELGGIIDPLTVEYDENRDFFRIISGERRYRAAKMVGLERLPCIVKEVDERQRLLLQLVANLQREDITPLEEASGIKALIEKFEYSQTQVSRFLNKSQSYVSQILGLERLGDEAREIVQTSELPKEVQIHASRERHPEKQVEILRKASEEGRTVREIRVEGKARELSRPENSLVEIASKESAGELLPEKTFRKWSWSPENKRFVITLKFSKEQSESRKNSVIKAALEEAHSHVVTIINRNY
jgi:ParB family chromosome partitioning protein